MKNYRTVLDLPKKPEFPKNSPEVVRVLDSIRKTFDDDEHGEFYWFAREYPRFYRYHLNHAEYRIKLIYGRYENFHSAVIQKVKNEKVNEHSVGFGESADSKQSDWTKSIASLD